MESAPEKSVSQKAERSERAAAGPASLSELPGANQLLSIPRLAGNMAMQRLLREGALRAKLAVGAPNDIYEQEADRVAESVLSSARTGVVQRKCGCGGSASNGDEVCASCADAQKIQPKLNGSNQQPATTTDLGGVSGFGRGRPLDTEIRSFMEARFNRDFRDVRVHTGTQASASAASINARAFTLNKDVVFGEGQYTPASTEGKRLLAHELTHVVQQGQALRPAVIQRQTTGEATGPTASTPQPAKSTALIVDDSTEDVEPHQMKRSQFIAQLRGAVAGTIVQTLSIVPFGSAMSEYIGKEAKEQFSQYSGLDARTLENLARRKVPGGDSATSASALIPLICLRVRQAVEAYIRESVAKASLASAEELGGTLGGAIGSGVGGVFGGSVGSAVGSGIGSAISTGVGLLFKANDGGPRRPDDPGVIRGQLRGGTPLDGRLRSEFSSVYGRDFSGVRIHADSAAAALASQFNARAFTYGQDIAFSYGEYKPGTLFGDALIAHELAHVAQQHGGNSGSAVMSKDTGSEEAFETDADMAAVGAMVSLWGGFKGEVSRIVSRVGPSLRSGLKLRRCPFFQDCNQKTEETPDAGPTPTASAKPAPPPPPKLLGEEFTTVPKRNEAVAKAVASMGTSIDTKKIDFVYVDLAAAAAATYVAPNTQGNKRPMIKIFQGGFLDGWPLLTTAIWHEYQHFLHPNVSEAYGEVEAYCKEIIMAEERQLEKEARVGVLREEVEVKFGKKELHFRTEEFTGKDYITKELWGKVTKWWAQCSKNERAALDALYKKAEAIVNRLTSKQ